MIKRLSSPGVLLAVVIVVVPTAEAQAEGPSAPVALLLKDPSQLVSWLQRNSSDVHAAAARLGATHAELAQARLLPNPSLIATLSDVTVGETNPPGLTFQDTASIGVVLSEAIEIGKRGPRIRSAQLRLDAGRESFRDAFSDLIGQARLALARVAHLKGRQAALEQSLADARQVLELQRSRLDHGDVSGNDYDRLLLDTTILEVDVAQNQAEYQGALQACAAAVFAACDPEDADLAALDAAADVPTAEAVPPEAISNRPDLRALALEEQSAREDAVLAGRRKIPDPSLSLGYTRDKLVISGDQPRTLLFGVSLPLPLFDHGQQDAARAQLRAEELRQTATATLARARADVASLLERRRALERSLGELKEGALPRSKSVLESTLAAVNQGQMSMTELLLARRTHTDLMLKVMDLQFSAFSVRNALRQAFGLDADLTGKGRQEPWKQP